MLRGETDGGYIRVNNATQSELTRNNDLGTFLLVSWQRRWGLSVTEGAAGEAEYIDQQQGSSSRCRWSHFRLLVEAQAYLVLIGLALMAEPKRNRKALSR